MASLIVYLKGCEQVLIYPPSVLTKLGLMRPGEYRLAQRSLDWFNEPPPPQGLRGNSRSIGVS